MEKICTACIQLNSRGDIETNIQIASRLISEAAEKGAQLICTPEMTALLERRPEAFLEKTYLEADDPGLLAFRNLVLKTGCWLLIGSLAIRTQDGKHVNKSYLLSPNGSIAASYEKIHLFDVQLGDGAIYRESVRYGAGSQAVLAKTSLATLGLSICYDLRFPHLYRDLAKLGAQILTVPSCFTAVSGAAHWHVLLRARAIETGCFVVAPAQTGVDETGKEAFGHSLIVSPWGEVLADAGTDPGVIYADLNLSEVSEARQKIPCLMHDRPYETRIVESR